MHKVGTDVLSPKNPIACSVVGARGYSGLELARLLMHHPYAKLTHCFATTKFKLTDYVSSPQASAVECLTDSEIMKHHTDVVFLATPAEVSLELSPQLLKAGCKVIDLSGAFRLKKNDYQKWYAFQHNDQASLKEAHYGLVNWAGPAKGERLVANPGCYATAVTMALIPLLKNKLINTDTIVVDAKSGATGAGKKAAENLLFTEVTEDCLPYKVGRHQHYPEIQEAIEAYTGQQISFHFSTSLLPIRRGIITAIYARLNSGVTIQDVQKAFALAYQDQALVSFGSLSERSQLASLRKVVGTAKTHISFEVVDDKLYVFSCIDNLLKGAAGQAIENLNRLSDLPTHTGLTHLEAAL